MMRRSKQLALVLGTLLALLATEAVDAGSISREAGSGRKLLQSDAPTDVSTEAPTDGPIDAPTDAPTDANDAIGELTDAPTDVPTVAPTEGDGTLSPTTGDETLAPTAGDVTLPPTFDNVTLSPTDDNTTLAPTADNTTLAPTAGDDTLAPTAGNVTLAPTAGNVTLAPTAGNVTLAPTAGNVTLAPTAGNVTLAPTAGNTTLAPTAPPTANNTGGIIINNTNIIVNNVTNVQNNNNNININNNVNQNTVTVVRTGLVTDINKPAPAPGPGGVPIPPAPVPVKPTPAPTPAGPPRTCKQDVVPTCQLFIQNGVCCVGNSSTPGIVLNTPSAYVWLMCTEDIFFDETCSTIQGASASFTTKGIYNSVSTPTNNYRFIVNWNNGTADVLSGIGPITIDLETARNPSAPNYDPDYCTLKLSSPCAVGGTTYTVVQPVSAITLNHVGTLPVNVSASLATVTTTDELPIDTFTWYPPGSAECTEQQTGSLPAPFYYGYYSPYLPGALNYQRSCSVPSSFTGNLTNSGYVLA